MNKKIITISSIILSIICIILAVLYFSMNNPKFNITFDSNGGTAITSQTVERGEKIIEPKDPTKEGYTFEGWYINLNDKSPFDFNTQVTSDINLIAKWTKTNVENNKDETNDDINNEDNNDYQISDNDVSENYNMNTQKPYTTYGNSDSEGRKLYKLYI